MKLPFRTLLTSTAILGLIACTPTTETTTTPASETPVSAPSAEATQVFNDWLARRFEEEVQDSPEFMAQLGRKTRYDEWDDESKAAWLEQMDRTKSDLEYLESVDVAALNQDAQLSHALYLKNARDSLEGMRFYGYGYPFNQMFGTHSGIPTFLLNNHRVATIEDAQAYVKRLERIPGKLDAVTERAAESFDRGIYPPKFVYAHVLRDIDNITSGLPFEQGEDLNLMLADFQKKVDELGLGVETREALYEDAVTAMQDHVGPAYVRLRDEMLRQQASATTDDGVWKLPDGGDFYAYRLRQMTTTDLSPDEIHDIGLREVARIHAEMRAIMDQVGFEGSLQDFFAFMRDDPQFYYPNTAEGKQTYLDEATALIDTISEVLPDYFNRMPKAALEVRAVEAFREKSAGKAFYSRPAADGSRPGYYYANLYDMSQMPIYQMEALAYHEGNPGHHMQIAIAQELEGVPDFRKFGGHTAFIEGWGLYSEYLPKEMGFYENPYSDFGRLAMELWRAGRLVVDTGLHHKRWSREKAIDYLKDNTPNPEGDIVKAIERYIVLPGQATAYMIGKIKILELREMAKAELGDDFNIGEFHDVVLASGSVPLDILETRVNNYIAKKKGG
jgi:uncharacterized protein (DUF885 family)